MRTLNLVWACRFKFVVKVKDIVGTLTYTALRAQITPRPLPNIFDFFYF